MTFSDNDNIKIFWENGKGEELMKKPIVVNLFGGSGYGKSTCAAYIFSQLKKDNYNVEFVFEFPKDLIYMTDITPPFNQAFVFGNQLWKIEQYLKNVDIVITDSPILLSIVYNNTDYLGDSFAETVIKAFNSFNNINFLIEKSFDYNTSGRYQTEQEASISHREIKDLLIKYQIQYQTVSANDYDVIINSITNYYRSSNKE